MGCRYAFLRTFPFFQPSQVLPCRCMSRLDISPVAKRRMLRRCELGPSGEAQPVLNLDFSVLSRRAGPFPFLSSSAVQHMELWNLAFLDSVRLCRGFQDNFCALLFFPIQPSLLFSMAFLYLATFIYQAETMALSFDPSFFCSSSPVLGVPAKGLLLHPLSQGQIRPVNSLFIFSSSFRKFSF